VTGSHVDNVGQFHYMPVKELNVTNICHPLHVIPNIALDKMSFDEITKSESILAKIHGLFYHIRKSKTR